MRTGLKHTSDTRKHNVYVYPYTYVYSPQIGIKLSTFYPYNTSYFVPFNAVCFAFHSCDMEAATSAVVMVTFAQCYLFLFLHLPPALVP